MLYVSTRNKTDSFTAYRVLHDDKAPDGGLFAPFHLPVFSSDEIYDLGKMSFSETVAKILNLFFSLRLTSWDVDFCIGRNPFRVVEIGQRVVVAELWHNNASTYDYTVSNLYKKLSNQIGGNLPQWVRIAVEIAMLFGLFGELLRGGLECFDVAVTDDTFIYPIAAWYAKKMGLPIGVILCGCNEESGLWDLLRKGDGTVNVSADMELLIYENFGTEEAKKFVAARQNNRIYRLTEECAAKLCSGIYPSVIGVERIPIVSASIKRTCGYSACSNVAAAYGALQDYRAATGENKPTLLLSRIKPKE